MVFETPTAASGASVRLGDYRQRSSGSINQCFGLASPSLGRIKLTFWALVKLVELAYRPSNCYLSSLRSAANAAFAHGREKLEPTDMPYRHPA
jgi:hypothetical protein